MSPGRVLHSFDFEEPLFIDLRAKRAHTNTHQMQCVFVSSAQCDPQNGTNSGRAHRKFRAVRLSVYSQYRH